MGQSHGVWIGGRTRERGSDWLCQGQAEHPTALGGGHSFSLSCCPVPQGLCAQGSTSSLQCMNLATEVAPLSGIIVTSYPPSSPSR